MSTPFTAFSHLSSRCAIHPNSRLGLDLVDLDTDILRGHRLLQNLLKFENGSGEVLTFLLLSKSFVLFDKTRERERRKPAEENTARGSLYSTDH